MKGFSRIVDFCGLMKKLENDFVPLLDCKDYPSLDIDNLDPTIE